MPSININEYDNTITGTTSTISNVVAIPINANDGPSDRWITVNSYEDFLRLFGPNPNSDSLYGNSWEYAANLLLRNMPVCVRRITNKLDEYGNNESELLDGCSTAKGILKIKNLNNSNDTYIGNYETAEINVQDATLSSRLTNSTKKEDTDNTLYIGEFNTEEELNLKEFKLTQEEKPHKIDSFADVIETQTEFKRVKEYQNPNYLGAIHTVEELNNKVYGPNTGKEGNFYVFEENSTYTKIRYTSTPVPNEHYKSSNSVLVPFDLPEAENAENLGLQSEDFYVINNKIYEYLPETESLKIINPKYIPNTSAKKEVIKSTDETITLEIQPFTVDEIKNAVGNNIAGEFIIVKESSKKYSIYTWSYKDSTKNTFDWVKQNDSALSVDSLFDKNSDIYLVKNVPFKYQENIVFGTGIYRESFNWKKDDEPTEEDKLLLNLYFKNTNNPINTTPHINEGKMTIEHNTISITSTAKLDKTTFAANIKNSNNENTSNIEIMEDTDDSRLQAGSILLTNNSNKPIRIYTLKIRDNSNNSIIYDAKLENITHTGSQIKMDNLLEFVDEKNNKLANITPFIDNNSDCTHYYIELNPGCTIKYNKIFHDVTLDLDVSGYDNFGLEIKTLYSITGYYKFLLSAANNTILKVEKSYIPKISIDDEDFNNLPSMDSYGNFNMFKIEYLYPGTNGNNIKCAIHTIKNQGVYIYVYYNQQYLERIELISFRYRRADGKIGILTSSEIDNIWKILLDKFAIKVEPFECPADPVLYSNYLKIHFNTSILQDYKSYDYVSNLLAQSSDTTIQLSGGHGVSDEHVKHELKNAYYALKDKYRYDISFISNGGYIDNSVSSIEILNNADATDLRSIESAMVDCATSRQDCVAYLDVPSDLQIENVKYYFEHLSTSYAAAYFPWARMSLLTGGTKWMPPSFVQLYTQAKAIQGGAKLYLPPAGVKRASVPEIIETEPDVSNNYIVNWQGSDSFQYVNPIIYINGYDYTVYGQKTLYNIVDSSNKKESALQNLNVRLVANEIKKLIFKTCISLTFELNNLLTWNEFKSKLEPTLSVMLAEGVLTAYNVVMGTQTMTSADLNSGHIVGTVRVAIANAVTDWDINFELMPNSVIFNDIDYNSTYSNSYNNTYNN